MDYFLLRQDQRYRQVPSMENFYDLARRKDFTIHNCHKIKDINLARASSPDSLDYIDILDRHVYLVSKEVKKVFLLYDPSLQFKMFCLLNQRVEGGEAGEYYAPIFPEVDCVSPKSEFNLDKSHIKRLVLFKRKIAHFPLFRVANINKESMIVRLDVLESLLRRKLRGLLFSPVEVE